MDLEVPPSLTDLEWQMYVGRCDCLSAGATVHHAHDCESSFRSLSSAKLVDPLQSSAAHLLLRCCLRATLTASIPSAIPILPPLPFQHRQGPFQGQTSVIFLRQRRKLYDGKLLARVPRC